MRFRTSLAVLSLGLALPIAAVASGDFQNSPTYRLRHANLTGADDMAMLGPGNDTRTNLTLLLFDRRGAVLAPGKGEKPAAAIGALFDWGTFGDWVAPAGTNADGSYASGEGSRCRSNDSGAAAFAAAAKSASLPGGERDALVAARLGLKPDCAKRSDGAAAVAALDGAVRSPAGRAFATYLAGAVAFYDGDFDAASARFGSLREARDPWVRETARYMTARVEVNRLQVGMFDEYGNPKSFDAVDQKTVSAAEAGLRAYAKEYPKGRYADSARGLLRRVFWFGGRRDQLAAEYAALLKEVPSSRGISDADLAEEIDNKLLPDMKAGDTVDPMLLAVLDLRRMRMAEDDVSAGCCGEPMPIDELNRQRSSFKADPALFEYLVAAHSFYVANRPAEVLRLIPDAARQPAFTDVQFSRQMLRGMALEATKDRNVRGFWIEMLPGANAEPQRAALELAIAFHDERAGALAKVFATDSPVGNPRLREILLANVADAPLLRRQASGAKVKHERELATFTLLYKELSRGHYRDFLSDLPLIPGDAAGSTDGYFDYESEHFPLGLFVNPTSLGDFDCPALKRTVTTLAATPSDNHARLCMADYFRSNGFDDFPLDKQPAKDELGGTPTLFAGPVYSRLEVYKTIIADPKAAAGDKAYALFRAVNCYGPNGNNSCGGTEVEKAQRKAWFQRLKREYSKSDWATQQQYYW